MKVHLQALGCRLNEAELETWSRDFRARGHQLCNDPAGADLLVVNTCAVTEEAVRKSRKLLRRAQRENPAAKLVVSGCYASLEPGEAGREMGVDLLVANRDKDRLVEIADREPSSRCRTAAATAAPSASSPWPAARNAAGP
jgi:threonylcarbamoyladenosine tRNA methylthiotransferase MtaB